VLTHAVKLILAKFAPQQGEKPAPKVVHPPKQAPKVAPIMINASSEKIKAVMQDIKAKQLKTLIKTAPNTPEAAPHLAHFKAELAKLKGEPAPVVPSKPKQTFINTGNMWIDISPEEIEAYNEKKAAAKAAAAEKAKAGAEAAANAAAEKEANKDPALKAADIGGRAIEID
jgi:ribosomal protein L12E/L44/L45/RPP1/RPP2